MIDVSKKVDIEAVKNGFLQYGYTCLEDPKGSTIKVKCQDENGYMYYMDYYNLINTKTHDFVSKQNPYTIHNIKQYLINNNIDLELLSDNYMSNSSKMQWKCSCGTIFESSWAVVSKGKHSCKLCKVRETKSEHFILEYETIKAHFERKGYILISKQYIPKQHLEYICPKHQNKGVQKVSWGQIKRLDTGCPYCAMERVNKQRRLPIEIVKSNVESTGLVFKDVIYGKASHPIVLAECPIHTDFGVQEIGYNIIRKGNGCPVCRNTLKTPKVFFYEISQRKLPIKILNDFDTYSDEIICQCTICNYEWKSTPTRILGGAGCKQCAIKNNGKKKAQEKAKQFYELFNSKYSKSIELLDEYKNCKSKILLKCKKHNYNFYSTPDLIMNGNPKYLCPKCIGEKTGDRCRLSQKEFEDAVHNANPNVIVLGEYKGNHERIKCRCVIHDYTWDVLANHIMRRSTGCPKCGSYSGENKIDDIFQKMGYKLISQKRYNDCRDKNPLPFDRFCEELNLIIEYDGEWHYMPIPYIDKEKAEKQLAITQYHDKIKNEYCKNHNINIIRVPYWENNNMEEYIKEQMKVLNLL